MNQASKPICSGWTVGDSNYVFDLDGIFLCRAEEPSLTGFSEYDLALARRRLQKAVVGEKVKEGKKIVAAVIWNWWTDALPVMGRAGSFAPPLRQASREISRNFSSEISVV